MPVSSCGLTPWRWRVPETHVPALLDLQSFEQTSATLLDISRIAVYIARCVKRQSSGGVCSMGELGDLLRRTREEKGLLLEQVEQETRIRVQFLEALEEEDYDRLPAPVYVKGFLRNYAAYLGLDPQEVLSLCQEPETFAPAVAAPAMLDEPLEPVTIRRYWQVLVLVSAVVVVLALWAYQRYYGGTLPFTRFVAPPTSVPTTTPTSVPPSPTVPPTVAPSPTRTLRPTVTPTVVGLHLSIEIVDQRSWVLVLADGERVFAGILEPGAKDTWTARERMVLRSGNAGAVRVTLNGQDLGLFGETGQVLEQEWTMPGVPTRTPAPTTAT